jgi:hypothetical protein
VAPWTIWPSHANYFLSFGRKRTIFALKIKRSSHFCKNKKYHSTAQVIHFFKKWTD